RNMRADNKTVIIITHKLHEVLAISDRVTILRKGKFIETVQTSEATEQSLTEGMVGQKVSLDIERKDPENLQERLIIKDLNVTDFEGKPLLKDINFTAYGGEILGIAGISGSGQKELLESIAGLQKQDKGSSIIYFDPEGNEVQLVGKTPKAIRNLGIALSFVPEDRLGMGLVGNMDIIDNMMLRSYKKGKTEFLDRKQPRALAEEIIDSLEVVTPSATTPVRRLSGGNVQKVLVGREISLNPRVLMVAYPVRGLDINSSYMIYNLLSKQKEQGVAVIFVGEDLDVLIELCDRIMVINSGEITGIVDGKKAQKEELGILMTKSTHDEEAVTDE
ncbi:MAG: ATP-binding cassette domain-containing protein, partial [Ruminococcaceae bacterium]|nr:ATP-binding cassette domain-containing protein [Oscillospiraceae bacterium]